MTDNPYQPPAAPSASYGGYVYRPIQGMAAVVTWFVAAQLVTGLGSSIATIGFKAEPGQLGPGVFVILIMSLLQLGVSITTYVLFLVWQYRATANAWAFGQAPMSITPGWAVGWYFIPFLSLFKPFAAMKETWQASAREYEAAPGIIGLWWFTWILSGVVSIVMTFGGMNLGPVIGAAVHVLPGVLVILVVRQLSARQTAFASELQMSGAG